MFGLALWASGLWLRYATLQNLIPSFPWIAPPRPPPRLNPRKGRDQILLSSNLVRAPHEWTYVGRTDISAGIAKSTQTQGHISRKYYVMMRNRKFKEILTIDCVLPGLPSITSSRNKTFLCCFMTAHHQRVSEKNAQQLPHRSWGMDNVRIQIDSSLLLFVLLYDNKDSVPQ